MDDTKRITCQAKEAPVDKAGASTGAKEASAPYELVRYLETDRLADAHRARTVGVSMFAGGVLIALSALWAIVALLPYLNETKFVMFEVEKSTGIVRIAQHLDAPYTPDERVRQYFITHVVQYMETFDRPDVDRMANVLRHFLTPQLLEEYVAHMRSLNERVGRGKRLVTVDSILPITAHENAQSLNQSTVDLTVTYEKRDGSNEVQHMAAIVTYRFVPYTKAELESTDEDMRDKIQKNPLGMEVAEYRVDAKLPIRTTTP